MATMLKNNSMIQFDLTQQFHPRHYDLMRC